MVRLPAHIFTSELESAGVKAVAMRADVADDKACRDTAKMAMKAFGRIDFLLNNAGTTKFVVGSNLDGLDADDWQRIFAVNVIGPFQCARAVKEPMLAGGGGQIINISSVAAFSIKGSSIAYAASKAALNNLTISLARALAPKIRVNAVAPGFIAGRWLEQGLKQHYEKAKATVSSQCPLERVSEPDDIAAAVAGTDH